MQICDYSLEAVSASHYDSIRLTEPEGKYIYSKRVRTLRVFYSRGHPQFKPLRRRCESVHRRPGCVWQEPFLFSQMVIPTRICIFFGNEIQVQREFLAFSRERVPRAPEEPLPASSATEIELHDGLLHTSLLRKFSSLSCLNRRICELLLVGMTACSPSLPLR